MSRYYARPDGAPIQLRVRPRLESWEVAGHPDQLRLAAALADTEELLTPVMAKLIEPLALRLDVGLPSSVPLLEQHDLDNYLHRNWSGLRRRGLLIFLLIALTMAWCLLIGFRPMRSLLLLSCGRPS